MRKQYLNEYTERKTTNLVGQGKKAKLPVSSIFTYTDESYFRLGKS